MKKIIIFICLILFSASCFAQVPPVSRPVCAFCEAEITLGEPHKPGCPNYVGPADSNTSSSSGGGSAATAPAISQSQLTAAAATVAVGAYISMLSEMLSSKERFNAAASKLYGVPGCEDDGYVVARGTDGYYSIWNGNGNFWATIDPDTSTYTDIILFNSRAACLQRWLGHKWSVLDLAPNGKYKKGPEYVVKKYDAVKCVAKDAPIAVGKGKNNNLKWGLVTRDPATEKWSHTVDDKWDDMDILPVGKKSFALGKSKGQTTLFSSEGKQLTKDSYSQITPFAEIDGKLYFLTENNQKWGLMTEDGQVAEECIYDEIKIDSEGIVGTRNNESVIISKVN